MKNTQKNQTVPCPECDTPIDIPADVASGKIVECPACGTESEFVNLDPFTLAPLEEEK